MTEQQIRNEMSRITSLISKKRHEKEQYKEAKNQVEKIVDDLKEAEEYYNKGDDNLTRGGFLVDAKPVDGGKIKDIASKVNNYKDTAKDLKNACEQEKDKLEDEIRRLQNQYDELERKLRNLGK